ncbi:hypothetical protein, conserved [Plasmodium gonderi]|uniref:Variable surface protein n=1 Tax=Plasmodium gonderi TaxID=77519 RepID=A0A1Y1JEE4_PLAGO|nr:hypothetical protein, conserved [Plasmodium gonderi]GAW79122.1 hypothetical protein, conserved [Plasmodium gonderi]
MKLLFRIVIFLFLLLVLTYGNDDINRPQEKKKKKQYRNKFRKSGKISTLNNEPGKNFLQIKSAHIYNPSISYRDFFDNNAMGTSTIYYNRLMWGAVIFLIMFILVSSIGIYLYVNNLENGVRKKRHVKNPTNYYVINPTIPYA